MLPLERHYARNAEGLPLSFSNLQFKEANIKRKKCLYLTNKITTNENLRLMQYKLMTRIYYTRDKLHTFYSDSSDQCVALYESEQRMEGNPRMDTKYL